MFQNVEPHTVLFSSPSPVPLSGFTVHRSLVQLKLRIASIHIYLLSLSFQPWVQLPQLQCGTEVNPTKRERDIARVPACSKAYGRHANVITLFALRGGGMDGRMDGWI